MAINRAVAILHVGKLITAHRECLCVIHSLAPREALIKSSLSLEVSQSVTMGLRNGFTVPAIVGYIRNNRACLLFEEPISIATILAEQRNGRDERENVRLNIVTPVSIMTPTGIRDCLIQDISLFGIKVLDEACLLAEGAEVRIVIDGLGTRSATVRWRQGVYVGLRFDVALGFKLLDEWSVAVNG